jgi:D-tagatose-1,6-bisphosphate aldolase subunit GatZ/KbaZ
VWRKLPAEKAMGRAEEMIAQYAEAGFSKIHLDTSMPCAGDPEILSDETIAGRAARLARVAEASHEGARPFYIVGTEVPVPGGASQGHALAVTTPQAAVQTMAVHKQAFAKAGLTDAWSRVVGLVVQPGVEFDNISVVDYDPAKARALTAWRRGEGLVFEAHSTDFQRPGAYKALVDDGFAILKVGPGVTFAMREAICALAEIEKLIVAPEAQSHALEIIFAVMTDDPRFWKDYYAGTEQNMLLFNSYSDRIRYYWPNPKIEAAIARLISNLTATPPPEILLSRYLPSQYQRVRAGRVTCDPETLIVDKIRDTLRPYAAACKV